MFYNFSGFNFLFSIYCSNTCKYFLMYLTNVVSFFADEALYTFAIIYYYLPSVKNTYELPHTLYRISYKLDTNIRNIDHFCLFFSFPFYYNIISLVFRGPVDRLYRSIWEQHIRFDYLDNVFTIYRLIKTNLYFLSLNEMIHHYSGRNWILKQNN